MAKYRILEENGKFYPQFEEGNEWRKLLSNEFTVINFCTYQETKTFLDLRLGLESKETIYECYQQKTKDSIVEEVINKIKSRSEEGIKKYGTTLDRKDFTTIQWIDSAIEEQMDNILYLKRLQKDLTEIDCFKKVKFISEYSTEKGVNDFIKTYWSHPNDTQLENHIKNRLKERIMFDMIDSDLFDTEIIQQEDLHRMSMSFYILDKKEL
jgi:hypothetical protein